MILQGAISEIVDNGIFPQLRSGRNFAGSWLSLKWPHSQLGKHWTWPGPRPHATPAHYYGQLSPVAKASWQAWTQHFDTFEPDGSSVVLNGCALWLLVNACRKSIGLAPIDTAPSIPAFQSQGVAVVSDQLPTTQGAFAFYNNGSSDFPDFYRVKAGTWRPKGATGVPLRKLRVMVTLDATGPNPVDVSLQYGRRYGAFPAGSVLTSKSYAFMTTGELGYHSPYFQFETG